jgi:hypothetical protein
MGSDREGRTHGAGIYTQGVFDAVFHDLGAGAFLVLQDRPAAAQAAAHGAGRVRQGSFPRRDRHPERRDRRRRVGGGTASDKGRRLRIYYAAQVDVCPPSFVLFVNQPDLMPVSYRRYLENYLRKTFDFTGTPIRIGCRARGGEKS